MAGAARGSALRLPGRAPHLRGDGANRARLASMSFARLFLGATLLLLLGPLPEAGSSAASRSASTPYLSAASRGPAPPPPPRSPPFHPHQSAGGGGCPRNGGRFVNVTEFGAGCLPWLEVPTFLDRTPQGKGLRGQRNFCRNPDGRSRPWCFYRNNRGRVDWGYCDCRQGEAGSPRLLSFLCRDRTGVNAPA